MGYCECEIDDKSLVYNVSDEVIEIVCDMCLKELQKTKRIIYNNFHTLFPRTPNRYEIFRKTLI